jgi:hypothetical protein
MTLCESDRQARVALADVRHVGCGGLVTPALVCDRCGAAVPDVARWPRGSVCLAEDAGTIEARRARVQARQEGR